LEDHPWHRNMDLLCIIAPERSRRQQQQQQQSLSMEEMSSSSSMSHWDEVISSLKRNELIELRLGWHEGSNLITSSARLPSLAKALKANTSLRKVSIGWHWMKHQRDLLYQMLFTLAESIRPHQLQSIHLVLNNWIPALVLSKFLLSQTSLSSLDLRAVTVKPAQKRIPGDTVRTVESDSLRSTDSSGSQSKTRPRRPKRSKQQAIRRFRKVADIHGSAESVETVVPVLLDSFFENHQYQALSVLRLEDCDLNDRSVLELVEHILPTSNLSVRGNRRLTNKAACALVEVAKAGLDMSLCDFSTDDCVAIARAVGARSEPLLEFSLCGNYRMESEGLMALLETCPFIVAKLDFSYCDLSEIMTIQIFQTLSKMGRDYRNDIFLRHLTLHGCRIGSTDATNALVELLKQNSPPLRSLVVNDDKNERKYLSLNQMQQIVEVMPHNFEMEDLVFDYHRNINQQQTWREIDKWLRLNRAGRRLLLPTAKKNNGSDETGSNRKVVETALKKDQDEWVALLNAVKAEDNLDSIYWVVRNSTERLETTQYV